LAFINSFLAKIIKNALFCSLVPVITVNIPFGCLFFKLHELLFLFKFSHLLALNLAFDLLLFELSLLLLELEFLFNFLILFLNFGLCHSNGFLDLSLVLLRLQFYHFLLLLDLVLFFLLHLFEGGQLRLKAVLCLVKVFFDRLLFFGIFFFFFLIFLFVLFFFFLELFLKFLFLFELILQL